MSVPERTSAYPAPPTGDDNPPADGDPAGGCGCQASSGADLGGGLALFLLVGLVLGYRRRD